MITGTVNSASEATIPLRLRARGGRQRVVQAVIDTGFDGELTLPQTLVASLGLPRRGRERGVLADGTVVLFQLYSATIIWDGRPRSVLAAVAGGTPLVGMALLDGYELTVEVRSGGRVRIAALPAP